MSQHACEKEIFELRAGAQHYAHRALRLLTPASLALLCDVRDGSFVRSDENGGLELELVAAGFIVQDALTPWALLILEEHSATSKGTEPSADDKASDPG